MSPSGFGAPVPNEAGRAAAARRRDVVLDPARRARPAAGDGVPGRGSPTDPADRRRGSRRPWSPATPPVSSRWRRRGCSRRTVRCSTRRRSPMQPDELRAAIAEPDATLVVTDTNRRQARRWGSGPRERRRTPSAPARSRSSTTPPTTASTCSRTPPTTTRRSPSSSADATVPASAYGNGVTYTPGDRAAVRVRRRPVDGLAGRRVRRPGRASSSRSSLDEPVTTDRLGLLTVQGAKNRDVSEVALSFDGGDPVVVTLGEAARAEPGQEVTFPERTFSTLRITIDATDRGPLESYRASPTSGSPRSPSPAWNRCARWCDLRPPCSTQRASTRSSASCSTCSHRRASGEAEVLAADEERSLQRWVVNPVARDYTLYGRATVSSALPDDRVDTLLGLPDAAAGGVTATSSARVARQPGVTCIVGDRRRHHHRLPDAAEPGDRPVDRGHLRRAADGRRARSAGRGRRPPLRADGGGSVGRRRRSPSHRARSRGGAGRCAPGHARDPPGPHG